MNKLLFGLVLGAILGAIDGSLAIVYHPEDAAVREDMTMIVMMGTFKGLASGLLIGYLARRMGSHTVGILVGLSVGFLLSVPLAFFVGRYHLEILLPGAVMGMILGYAVQRYGGTSSRSPGAI